MQLSKEKIESCISAINKHEIYETEKLMKLVSEIDSIFVKQGLNSLVKISAELKDAVLSGDEG